MLLQNIRAKIGARLSGEGEAGFTLVELLVVMLILGVLAAIAIPAFFNQASKATDASAKETLHTAQTTMATCLNENSEEFSKCTQVELNKIEGANPKTSTSGKLTVTVPPTSEPTKREYTLASKGANGVTWKVEYKSNELKYTCAPITTGACPTSGNWSE